MRITKQTAILSLLLSITVITFLSYVNYYWFHLRVDIYGQYINHAKSFLLYTNLANIGYNEYQPVAVMFFALLSPALLLGSDMVMSYINALYFANIILIIVIAYLTYKYTKSYLSIIVFSLIILFAGPIVLNRFELLVFLFLLLSIYFYKSNKKYLAYSFLGVATLTKIYPIIFAPYFFITELKGKKPIKNVFMFCLFYALGALAVILVFNVVLKADFLKVFSDLKIHSLKPIHTESVYTSFLTFYHKVATGNYPQAVGEWGIRGLKEPFIILPKAFYNYFWVIAITTFYIALLFKKVKNIDTPKVLMTVILLFLVTSKILAAQYLLWFALFFPLIKLPKNTNEQNSWQVDLFLILAALFLSQIVYPLKYTEFVDGFFINGTHQWLFYTIFIRNIILVILLIRNLKDVFKKG
jgi:hypothetical protein